MSYEQTDTKTSESLPRSQCNGEPDMTEDTPADAVPDELNNIFPQTGCHRMRFVGADFGYKNTTFALVEVRGGLPPDYKEMLTGVSSKETLEAAFDESDAIMHDGTSPPAKKKRKKRTPPPPLRDKTGQIIPWVTVLVAVKIDIENGTYDTYFDPEFTATFGDVYSAAKASRGVPAIPFDARLPVPHAVGFDPGDDVIDLSESSTPEDPTDTDLAALGYTDKQIEKEHKRRARAKEKREKEEDKRRKKRKRDVEAFSIYPRLSTIRCIDDTRDRGRFDVCTFNIAKFLSSATMEWLFTAKYPFVYEAQVDHLRINPGEFREPYNWAECHAVISAIVAMDSLFDRCDGGRHLQRFIKCVATKYGVDEYVALNVKDYKMLSQKGKHSALKDASIEVMNSLPLKREFRTWFNRLRHPTTGRPKKDDVADAVLMAIQAVNTYCRRTKLTASDVEKHDASLRQARDTIDKRSAKDQRASAQVRGSMDEPPPAKQSKPQRRPIVPSSVAVPMSSFIIKTAPTKPWTPSHNGSTIISPSGNSRKPARFIYEDEPVRTTPVVINRAPPSKRAKHTDEDADGIPNSVLFDLDGGVDELGEEFDESASMAGGGGGDSERRHPKHGARSYTTRPAIRASNTEMTGATPAPDAADRETFYLDSDMNGPGVDLSTQPRQKPGLQRTLSAYFA